MNFGIVTSFIIGGLLLISILTLNNQVMKNASETTVEMIARERTETLRKLISHDFSRIGFGDGAKIQMINDKKIQFRADVFDNGVKEFSWHFLNSPVKGTTNPDDKVLQRVGTLGDSPPGPPLEFSVVHFKLTAYEDLAATQETTDTYKIKCIKVDIVYESGEPISQNSGAQNIYNQIVWSKTFYPGNIQNF